MAVVVVNRSRHHVALTDAGRVFLRETKDILDRALHARAWFAFEYLEADVDYGDAARLVP